MTDDGLLTWSDLGRGLRTLARKAPAIGRLVKSQALANDDTLLSLCSTLADAVRKHPGRVAIRSDDGALTYASFDARANRMANLLISRGVRPGDAVAVMMEARLELLVAVAGIAKAGGAAAMINTNQRRAALVHSFGCVGATHVVIGAELVGALAEIRGEIDVADDQLLFVADGDDATPPAGWTDLLTARADSSPAAPPTATRVRMADPAFYIFTSGTTGLPKASIMSHKRWVGAGMLFGGVCLGLQATDSLYAPLPLYHNHALTLCWASAMTAGATLIIRRKFSASAFWDDCRTHGATAIAYIGEIARYLLNSPPQAPDGPGDRDHGVRKAVGIGMRPELWDAFKARFGVDEIYEYYGASELNVGFFNAMNLDRTVGFCPFPWAMVEYDVDAGVPVRGPDGYMRKVGRGATGLLVTQVTDRFKFEGYTDPIATESKLLHDVFEGGDTWIHTGDLMRNIGMGHLQFVDRVGDTFRWKSENVATSEVERAACAAPSVAECTVYGVEIPGTAGRAGMIALVPSDPNAGVDQLDLLSRLQADLPRYAIPLFTRTTDSLATTGTFKHRKVELRRQGFDPATIDEPLHVLMPGATAYQPLTAELHVDIAAGQVAF